MAGAFVAIAVAWLPSDPPRPCPEVLDEADAALYLRLDPETATHTLKRYRLDGRLQAKRVGKALVYRRVDLDKFIEDQPGH